MPSTTSNIITTTALTLVCAAVLFLSYRHALRPILNRYNIPLQSLPSILTNRSRGWMDTNYQRLNPNANDYDSDNEDIDDSQTNPQRSTRPTGDRRLSRDLEEGFKDSDSDDEDERLAASRAPLRELPPTPVEDDRRDRFPTTRI